MRRIKVGILANRGAKTRIKETLMANIKMKTEFQASGHGSGKGGEKIALIYFSKNSGFAGNC
ncbi:MAG: hypothetical protein ACXVCS_10175 [Bdellovibrionota bacterium]